MTVTATITTGRSKGNPNLHGTLKFMATKYCSKSNKRRNTNKIQKLCLPRIRRSSAPQNRLQVLKDVVEKDIVESKEKILSSPKTDERSWEEVSEAAVNESMKESGREWGNDEKRKTCVTINSVTKLYNSDDLAKHEEALNIQHQALKRIEAARRKVYNDQVQQIWGVYTYGLKHVLALNDLSDAPDAILPGNF